MADERRNQERFPLNLQARLSRISEDTTTTCLIATVAANLSSGGAFLETDHILPLATRVRVDFWMAIDDLQKLKIVASTQTLRQLADQTQVWVQATGVVIRRESSGMAVIFDQNYQLSPIRLGSDDQ